MQQFNDDEGLDASDQAPAERELELEADALPLDETAPPPEEVTHALGDMVSGVDLLGDDLSQAWQRHVRQVNRSSEELQKLRTLGRLKQRGDPIEVAHFCMMQAFAKQDFALAFDRAIALLPFFNPRLQALAVGIGGAAPGTSGAVQFSWASDAATVKAIEAGDAEG